MSEYPADALWMVDYSWLRGNFHEMKLLKDYTAVELRRVISIKEQHEYHQGQLEAF